MAQSSDLNEVITHRISNPAEWPSPVHKLSQLLQHCGLSHSIASITHPLSPHRVSELVQEVSERLAAPDNAGFTLHESPSPLSIDLRDFILLSVADIREIRRRRQYGCFQHTRTFSLPLISRLGLLCDENASVFADASFILPRAASARLGQLDGHFELLIAFVTNYPRVVVPPGMEDASSTQDEEHEEDALDEGASPSVEEEEISEFSGREQASRGNTVSHSGEGNHSTESNGSGEASDHGESDVDSDDESIESGEDDEGDGTSSGCSLDMPLCAHLLPGRGRRLWCAVPVIAVANSDDISPLLSSILYQRFVWGIDLPAVGITISESGDVARVILAWLDLASDVDEGLPRVHVAYADEQATCPSLGVFDLSDPIHAIMFSQFFLGLRSHFQDVKEGTREPRVQPLSWRSDHIVHDLTYNKGLQGPIETYTASIFRWASQVSDDTRGINFPLQLSPPNTLPAFTSTMAPKSSTAGETGKSGDKGKSGEKVNIPSKSKTRSKEKEKDEIAQSVPQSIPSITQPNEATTPNEPATKSYYSSSSLAALSEKDVETELSISSFLFERAVISITRIRFLGTTTEPSQCSINIMIDFYDKLTQYCWLESWTAANDLSVRHPEFESTCKLLFQEHQGVSQRLGRDSVSKLDVDLALIMSRKLPEALLASAGVYSLLVASTDRSVSEAESRHNWDALLYRFSVIGDEPISNNVLLERTVNYPRNPAFDEFQKARNAASALNTVQTWFWNTKVANKKLLDEALQIVSSPQNQSAGRELIHQLHAFLSDANRTLEMKNMNIVKAQVESHSPKEPTTGKADAILVIPIRGTQELKETTKATRKALINKFSLVRHSDPYARTENKSIQSTLALVDTTNFQAGIAAASQPSPTTTNSPNDLLHPLGQASASELKTMVTKLYEELRRAPLFISCTESQESTDLPKAEPNLEPPSHTELDFRFPILMVEHKRNHTTLKQALNQVRLYCTAAVSFLATLDITEQPVFGLVTFGSKGTVILCWKFKDQIYIMERNMRTFDISKPLQAFHFATFLLRLAKWSQTLYEKYSAKDKNLANKLYNFAQEHKDDPTTIWVKEAQNPKIPKEKTVEGKEVKGKESKKS